MKTITILITILITFASCNCQKKTVEATSLVTNKQTSTMKLVYEANTRGFYQKIVVQNQKFTVSKDRDGKDVPAAQKISNSEWKKIIEAFQVVDLEAIPNLKSPTEKRFYDGAAIANLKITYQGKTYTTPAFDHGNPPVEIEKLVNKITVLGLPQ